MNKGSCLCGSVTWELTGEPSAAYNCHCKICQKSHGTAFGTYYFVEPDQLRWTSSTDTIVKYKSSEFLTRYSCDVCGSVVPSENDDGSGWGVPAGGHDQGKKPDSHIFAANNPPWHDLTGDLPRHDAFPEGVDFPVVADKPLEERPEGIVRGSCQCGAVEFHITKPLTVARNCHCSRCRRARAAAHASNGFTAYDGLHFVKGEDQLKSYKVPGARYFSQVFCKICSSPMPKRDPERQIAVVPLGSLDDDPGIKPIDHIFVNDKAGLHDITDDLPTFEEGPA